MASELHVDGSSLTRRFPRPCASPGTAEGRAASARFPLFFDVRPPLEQVADRRQLLDRRYRQRCAEANRNDEFKSDATGQ